MRTKTLLKAVVAACLLVGLPVPALATAPTDVTIRLVGSGSGAWAATGAIQDAGIWKVVDSDLTGSIRRSPRAGSFHETIALTGRGGSTFTVQDQGLFKVTSAGCCTFVGHWVIGAGTGAYAALRGQGTASLAFPTMTLQGQAHLNGP